MDQPLGGFAQSALVFVGGGTGACLRYWTGVVIGARPPEGLPVSTLLVNLIGSFLIGLLLGMGLREPQRLLLVVGVLGGFTTFSSFSAECVGLLQEKAYTMAALYVAGSVVLCVTGAALGFLAIRFFGYHQA